jgi:type II secretion system protein J
MLPRSLGLRHHRSRTRRGFTLVEVLVAGIVAAGLAIATATSLSSVLRARVRSEAREAAHSRADQAAARIARDVLNIARDPDLRYSHLALRPSASQDRDEIPLLIRSLTPVRNLEELPEGGLYEVQYRIATEEGQTWLWRRIDPAFDPVLDGGGIATALVRGIVAMRLEAYDGQAWFDAWDSDSDGHPHAVRITITGADDSGATRAIARRTIALDRVPLPPTEEADAAAQPASSRPSGNSGSQSQTQTQQGGGQR